MNNLFFKKIVVFIIKFLPAIWGKERPAFPGIFASRKNPDILHFDGKVSLFIRYKTTRASSAYSSRNKPVFKGEKPSIPTMDTGKKKDKQTFLTTTSDGSTTVL